MPPHVQRCCCVLCAVGFVPSLSCLAAAALPMLLQHFGNGTQSVVHLLSCSKIACYVWFEDDDISAFCIFSGVFAPNTFAEVVFGTQCIRFFGSFSPTLFLHSSS